MDKPQIVITPDGWNEVTTRTITIQAVMPHRLFTVEQWLRASERAEREDYRCCARCQQAFQVGPDQYVYAVFTNEGGKMVCQTCQTALIEGGAPVMQKASNTPTEANTR